VIFTDNCGPIGPSQTIRHSQSGQFTATSTGLVSFEIENFREGVPGEMLYNYTDNLCMVPQTCSFEALDNEIDANKGGTADFGIHAGPAYANKWYIILQGFTGCTPGFDMNAGTVHVPLNIDVWTWIALDLNPLWSGFYSQLDGVGEATATLNTFGPQPVAAGLALNFVYLVLQNPGSTPIFASNPVFVLFTTP
jgi:hypothetical protein